MRNGVHPYPVRSVPLTASPKRVQPMADDLRSESIERGHVGRHGVVREVTSRNGAKPATLFGQGLMPTLQQGGLERLQSRPHPRLHRMPRQKKRHRPGFAANVRKTKEVEGLRRSFQTPLLPPFGRKAPKGDEPGLVRMQFQREALQPFGKRCAKPICEGRFLGGMTRACANGIRQRSESG